MTQFYFPDVISDIPESERWIPNFVGYYTARADGKIFSYHNGRKELKPQINKQRNRLFVNLVVCNDVTRMDVHNIIANLFLDNPNGYVQVHFIDGNPANVCADNLAWKAEYRLDALPKGCQWLPSYRGLYYTDSEGNVFNKYHNKQTGTPLGNCLQYTLWKEGNKEMLLVKNN